MEKNEANFFLRRRLAIAAARGEPVSQLDIATAAGVHRVQISQWENGRCIPRLIYAGRLAKAYDVPLKTIERVIIEMSRAVEQREAVPA